MRAMLAMRTPPYRSKSRKVRLGIYAFMRAMLAMRTPPYRSKSRKAATIHWQERKFYPKTARQAYQSPNARIRKVKIYRPNVLDFDYNV